MTFIHETGYETGGDGYDTGAGETEVNLSPVILPADSPDTLDVSSSGVGSAENLDQIASLVRNGTDCPLAGHRTNAGPGEGNQQAELMFIGEGPGCQDDRQGRPCVGPAG